MSESNPHHPFNKISGIEKIAGIPESGERSESLEDVSKRVQKFFDEQILPRMQKGEKVLVVAHKHSLRSLSMLIEDKYPQALKDIKIENAEPVKYKITVGADKNFSSEKTAITAIGTGRK